MRNRKKSILTVLLIGLTLEAAYADILKEYSQLLYELKNYNTLGFFIMRNTNGEMIWQRGPMEFTGNILDLAPKYEGFFKLTDAKEKKNIYSRIGIFRTDYLGRLVNIDGYLLYPTVQFNDDRPHTLSVEGSKLIVEYQDEEIPSSESFDLHLYWPQNPVQERAAGRYFSFQETERLVGADIVSGFVEHSGVSIPSVAARMIALVSEIDKQYGDKVIFLIDPDPLKIGQLDDFLEIALSKDKEQK